MLLLPGSQLPASPGDNRSEELQGWGQARPLLASITAAPSAQACPVSFLSSFPCFPSLLFLQKSFSLPRPSSLHRHRIRPCRVCSVSTPTPLWRRKQGSDWGQRSRPSPQDSKAAPRTHTNPCTCTPISHRARTPKAAPRSTGSHGSKRPGLTQQQGGKTWPRKPHSSPQWDTCSGRELPPGETPWQDTAPGCAPRPLPRPEPPRRSRFRFLLYPRGHFASSAGLAEEPGRRRGTGDPRAPSTGFLLTHRETKSPPQKRELPSPSPVTH